MSKTTIWLVYHNRCEAALFQPVPELWKEREKNYQLVAAVEAESLEEVYRLTNHLDRDWRENALVKSLATTPPRSTSVGDVIVQGNLAWLVDHIGFQALS